MKQEEMTVVKQIELAPHIYELTLAGELVQEMSMPGQFIHIRVPRTDLLLRRPISLAEISKETGTCKIIYRADGDGTRVLAEFKTGDSVDVLGPLGKGFPIDMIEEGDVVHVIGGGIGVPPLYELGRQLKAKNANIVFMNGFADKSLVYYEEAFKTLGTVLIATDNGSYGASGHVGILMDQVAEQEPKAVFACGAKGLLKSVESHYPDHPHVYISMEERMACGVGACYACVCQSKKDPSVNVKVCDEGPVFRAGEIVL